MNMKNKKKLIVFDVDGSLLDNKRGGLKDLLVILGKEKEVEELDKEYQKRKFLGPWGLEEVSALYKGFDKEKLQALAFSYCKDNLMQGAKETVSHFKKLGYLACAISSNPQFLLDALKDILFLDFAVGLELEFKDGEATGNILRKVDRFAKAEILKEKMREYSITPKDVIVLGDSVADVPMAKEANKFIAISPDTEAQKEADVIINKRDLRGIIKLRGILKLPKTEQEDYPLVIVCHGFGQTKSQRKFALLARELANNNIASFRFDFLGHGDSEGDIENVSIKSQQQELEAVFNNLLKNERIDKNNIFILGHSLGALVTCLFEKDNQKAKGLILVSPAIQQKELMQQWNTKEVISLWQKQGHLDTNKGRLGLKYLKEALNLDWQKVVGGIQCPVLILHGKDDEDVPLKYAKEVLAILESDKQLVVVENAEHHFESQAAKQALNKQVLGFIKKYVPT